MKKVLLIILAALIANSSFAQNAKKEKLSVKIDQIYSENYPEMTAYVSVKNKKGEVIPGLAPGLFMTRVDSVELKGKQTVVPFSMNPEPINYNILISNNGIMEGEPLDFQKSAIIQFVDYMQKGETLSVYTIGDGAVPIFESLPKESIDTKLISDITISEVQPRIYDSLKNVINKIDSKKTKRNVIIIISDGRDQDSRFKKEKIDIDLNEKSIPVYAIGISVISSAGLSALNQLSEGSSGTYIYNSSVGKIPNTLKNIHDIITKCYVINYKIKNIKPDNNYHLLEVSVEERDSSGVGQRTFFAVKLPVPRWMQILFIVLVIVAIVVIVILLIIIKIKKRRAMGITRRKCPVCKNRMKDSWDYCPFCKYMPELAKKKNKNR